MDLIQELNEDIRILSMLSEAYEDLSELDYENLLTELDINPDDSIDYVPPKEKPIITRSSSQERGRVRTPLPSRGSIVALTIDGNTTSSSIIDDSGETVTIAFKDKTGRITKKQIQKANLKFKAMGKSSGKPIFDYNKPQSSFV